MTAEQNDAVRPADETGQNLADFGELAVRLSRLLGRLANLEAFKGSPFGLIEWVALSLIAQGVAKNNRQLARNLGVSRQRANQIKTALEKQRLVQARQSNKDARISLLSLTTKGQAELEMVDATLHAELAGALSARQMVLVRVTRSLRILTRLLGPQAEDAPSEVRRRRRRRKAKALEPAQ